MCLVGCENFSRLDSICCILFEMHIILYVYILGQTYAMARNGKELQGKCRVEKHDMRASLHRKVGSHHPIALLLQ